MVNEEIVGTDIDMNWTLNGEGDISLVSASDNISQAIYLRLTAYFDSLSWCYTNYGSFAKDWLGKNQTVYNRDTLQNEVLRTVHRDPRIKDVEVELKDWGAYWIGFRIKVWVENKSYEDYYIFGNLPRKNEDVHHQDYLDTYIDAYDEYYTKPGQIMRVHCHVLDENDKRVPIGEVSLRIGNYQIQGENILNPQEIAQSGSKITTDYPDESQYEPGSNTFVFRVPLFIQYGDHDLVFYYKGIRGYNSSTKKSILHVVDRIPTSTHYIYKRKGYKYYYANDYDYLTEPKVYVLDYNKGRVDHGEVRYYLDEGDLDGKYMIIDYPLIFLDGVLLQEEVYIKIKEEILDCCNSFIFELNRMFHTHDRITVRCAEGKIVDYLEVNLQHGIYFLTSTELIFDGRNDYTKNCDIELKVIE